MAKRLCACGCGASLAARRAGVEYVNDTHRKRGARKRPEDPEAPRAAVRHRPADKISRDEADRRKAVAQAELAELELAQERGDLVPVKDVEDRIGRFIASTRAQLLAVVGDVRQELPGLSREHLAKVDEIVRRRLDVSAGAGERGDA